MSGPRNYDVGTERALYLLSRGKCYFPSCNTPVITFVRDTPVSNVHIAHIRGANPGSPRFDPSMSDAERASFGNLLLLCKPHHDIVDRIEPEQHSVASLTEWKTSREGDSAGTLLTLSGLTEERLVDLIEEFARVNRPVRRVITEVSGGIEILGQGIVAFPVNTFGDFLQSNPSYLTNRKLVVTTIRNLGELPATVECVDIEYHVKVATSDSNLPMRLVGRNDFPFINPTMPYRLASGESVDWITDVDTFQLIWGMSARSSSDLVTFLAECRLGSGEVISSAMVSIFDVPLNFAGA